MPLLIYFDCNEKLLGIGSRDNYLNLQAKRLKENYANELKFDWRKTKQLNF